MTTLYRPVLIESAEQAEALPAGTVALHGSPGGRTVASRLPDPHGLLLGWITSDGRESFAGMVGWTALVPIEAEERIGSEMCHQITDKRYDIHVLPAGDEKQARWQIENNPDYATGRIMRQYRTPWEEA